MIHRLFDTSASKSKVAAFYGAIVAQARLPVFYRDYGVPDSVGGRFEMIVLHLALVLDRLSFQGAPEGAVGAQNMPRLGQKVFDQFCQDMDDHLREMGVGDLGVPKKMRRIAEAFYGRQAAYRAALAHPDVEPLSEIIARNVFADAASAKGAPRLAAYMRAVQAELAGKPAAADAAGLAWPDPASISSNIERAEGPKR